MGTKKKGMLTTDMERHKHMEKWYRRVFWRKERAQQRKDVVKQVNEHHNNDSNQ